MNEREIKVAVTSRVHALADQLDWVYLTIEQRRRYYEAWTNDENIGGLLRQVIDANRVRVWLKDTVMKNYLKQRRPSITNFLSRTSVSCGVILRSYRKPEAVLCEDTSLFEGGNLFTLTGAKEWRVALMSAYERAAEIKKPGRNILYIIEHTSGRFADESYRSLISGAGAKLGVEVVWVV